MLLCNHQYEWSENFSQMFRGFLRDVKLILKLMLYIDTYNKANMMLKYIYIYKVIKLIMFYNLNQVYRSSVTQYLLLSNQGYDEPLLYQIF